jgi:DNA-binding transcriptional MocR family regulator
MALKGVDISRTVSAGGLVFEALRRAIIEGSLKDGDSLRQDEIARLFNTSRIPVREAITMLEQQGLVKNHRFKGAVVVGLSLDEAGEIFDFRCIRLCCTNRVRDSSRESSVIAGPHEQTDTPDLQDPELASLQRGAQAPGLADDLVRSCHDLGCRADRQARPPARLQ